MAKARNEVHNFNAGPAALPLDALEKAREELVNFRGSGISLMEASHRSKLYEDVHNHAKELLAELLNVPSGYEILLLQGGASLQFAMLPMNFVTEGHPGAYVKTGSWADKALSEAKKVGPTRVAGSSEEVKYHRTPAGSELSIEPTDAYVHITSNETIGGVQWKEFPNTNGVPLVSDMSSDILSRPIPVEKFSFIYAGAQKNLGPSGVTAIIAKSEFLQTAKTDVPTILSYGTHVKNNSLYNTPPTFGIYVLSLVLDWVKEHGGVNGMQALSEKKSGLIYDAIDESDGFFNGYVDKEYRSLMNVTFGLRTPELEKKFLEDAKEIGFIGLNGHRSVGGCRASIYNAVPLAACERLVEFMHDFARRNK